jgi:hypothetical protein
MEYIFTGLDTEFNPIISALIAKTESITIDKVYLQLLSFETRMDLLGEGSSGSSANIANKGGHGGFGRGCNNSNRGCAPSHRRGGGFSNINGNNSFTNNSCRGGNTAGCGVNDYGRGNNSNSRPMCQVCLKTDHTAEWCWHRFDHYVKTGFGNWRRSPLVTGNAPVTDQVLQISQER